MLCLITYDWCAGCGYGCYFCRVVIVIFGLRELVLVCRVVNGWCLLDSLFGRFQVVFIGRLVVCWVIMD